MKLYLCRKQLQMSDKVGDESYYDNFKLKLIDSQPWPGPYMYKFIVKKDSSYLGDIKSFFEDQQTEIKEKKSSKGSYISLTILATNQTPDAVVSIYKQVKEFKGVIIL